MSKYSIQSYRVRSLRELCRVTLYPNPMAVDLLWTWPKVTFCNRVFCCCPTGTFLLCPPWSFCAPHFYTCCSRCLEYMPTPSSWPGEASWILYNPDYVSCHHSTNMYWSARSETQGDWKQTQPLLLVELPSHLCETPCFQVPASAFFPQAWVCMCLCIHMFTRDCMCVYTYVYTYSHTCIHTCTHTFYSTDVHWILLIGWWIFLFHQTKFFTLRDHTSLFHFIIKSPSLSL